MKCSRRIRPIVSTVSIPPTARFESQRAAHRPTFRGSILDADPPAQGVKIARRNTECRHLDPKALHELRLGKGESYRQALVSILRSSANGLDFRSLCTEPATRQGHRPSRSTIRTVLCQSPGFILKDGSWRWRDVPDSARVFRRRVILSAVTRSGGKTSDLAELARVVGRAIEELSP